MQMVQNFPFFTILLSLMCAVVMSVLSASKARKVVIASTAVNLVLTLSTLVYTLKTGESYVYMMGHFPAPWGNEIRIGVVETVFASVCLTVILLSFVGGLPSSRQILEDSKYNIYCIVTELSMLSLLALVYTNDLFTAYVFIEINTLAAAGLVMMRQTGRSLVAGVRYMIMNLLGSSLFLVSVVILYSITGHLLMVPIHEKVQELAAQQSYRIPLATLIGMMSVGLAMKSALFPFEKWLPGAYSNTVPTGSAILSSIVSKGYIFLLVKVYVRVIGLDVIRDLGVCDVMFIFGAAGMIMGSINAIRSRTTRMMTAYSSVAQIGYIFLCIGMGNELGMLCALWHAMVHSATKSMLFISGATLDYCSGDTHLRSDLKGSFWRTPWNAMAFTVGGANLVGVPLLGTFVTKLLLAQNAIGIGGRHMVIALICLAVSTILNVGYFMVTIVQMFIPGGRASQTETESGISRVETAAVIGFILLNLAIGLFASPILSALQDGLVKFA